MRILQINNYHYLRGGSERVYLETSELLEKNGHKVIHFSVNDKDSLESPYKDYFIEPVHYLKNNLFHKLKNTGKFIYSFDAEKRLKRLIQNERPDIAHLHIFYGRLTSSVLRVLKRHKIPTIMTVHEYKMVCPAYTFLNSAGMICEKCAHRNYLHFLLQRCNKKNVWYSFIAALECSVRDIIFPYEKYIDKFIMVSKFVQGKYLHYRPYLSTKAVQIYNFINTNTLKPNCLQGDYYLYFGRLSSEKGLLSLLKAWKYFPHIPLKIVGDGIFENEILRFIRMNDVKNVELLGFLAGNELSHVIRNCKFTLVPSEWYETFGLNIIESFACGKPVIASKIGAIPELVQDTINGFLFESQNVESLVNTIQRAENISHEEYRTLSNNCRRFIEVSFSEEVYYKKLMQVYSEVLL
ncbi:MAG: glycosyltransferase [wastewater metagenome]|nr:glycosyltransferase [Candidatus Loosdrechtia aerotolerans]